MTPPPLILGSFCYLIAERVIVTQHHHNRPLAIDVLTTSPNPSHLALNAPFLISGEANNMSEISTCCSPGPP
ncbi:hypothetical protein BDZ97DRAFT_1823021 [Flammula alnicola]|nr:hypothetical protein BDZ97DRAFT_1823021 [Flammula alnicola]